MGLATSSSLLQRLLTHAGSARIRNKNEITDRKLEKIYKRGRIPPRDKAIV